MKEKKKKNPIAVGLANMRWRKRTAEEKLAHGRKLTDARLAKRKVEPADDPLHLAGAREAIDEREPEVTQ